MQKRLIIFTFIHKGILRIHSYKGVLKMLRYPNTLCINIYGDHLTFFNRVFFKAKMKILCTMYNTDIHTIRFNVKNTDIRIKNKKIEFKLI